MGKRFLPILYFAGILLLFLYFLPSSVSAHHKKRVLGEATTASQLSFPPVTAGPGFILPDSPLFFVDKAFQAVRLVTAFTPEQKAKVRTKIAGERLAELRLMLSRNNNIGINTALNELNKEVAFSAQELTEAKAQGKNVETLAKEVNLAIKEQRRILSELEHQSIGSLRLQFKATRKALKESKVEIEDVLPEDELAKEIEEGLNDEIERGISDSRQATLEIEHDLNELRKESTQAAEKAFKRRGEALKRAIEEKNEQLKKVEENALEAERKKQEELLKVSKTAAEQAKKAVQQAQEAAKRFREIQDALKVRNNSSESKESKENINTTSSGDSDNEGRGEIGENKD